jgi:hypothetical protein
MDLFRAEVTFLHGKKIKKNASLMKDPQVCAYSSNSCANKEKHQSDEGPSSLCKLKQQLRK